MDQQIARFFRDFATLSGPSGNNENEMNNLMKKAHDNQGLIEAAKSGNREAFETLVSKDRDRIRALVASRLNARIVFGVEVDDVYQESLLRAYRSIANFEWRGRDSFLHWLGGIAENVILHLARKRARERKAPLDQEVPVDVVSPSRAIRREERFQRLGKWSTDSRCRPELLQMPPCPSLKVTSPAKITESPGRRLWPLILTRMTSPCPETGRPTSKA